MSGAGGTCTGVRVSGAPWLALSILWAALTPTANALAQAADAQLLAHGSPERYWVARVYSDPGRAGAFVTDVYGRSAGDANWHQVARVEGRTVQVAHRGGQLALLMDGGTWLLVSEETVVTGRPPPSGARLLSLAPWGDTLAALARVYDPAPAGRAAQQSPATGPAATRRSPLDSERLALLTLTPQGWADAGAFDVDAPLPRTPAEASLAVIEGTPTVAAREGPRSVGVYRRAPPDGAAATTPASDSLVVETPRPIVTLKLLAAPVPVLWTVEDDGAARLHWLTSAGVRSTAVELGAPAGAGRRAAAATFAAGRVRVVYGDGVLLSERSYDPLAATPVGPPARVELPRTPVVPPLWEGLQSLLPVLLLFTIIASLRRRREMQETLQEADRLPLAPFGRRLLAGAIDATPVFAAAALVYYWEKRAEAAGGPLFGSRSQVAMLAGLVAYLLHTTASEVASGRTIGKLCCGLRVAGLDGQRPAAGALLTRNLLRLIDLLMMFFPLVLVLYSPLRQRAGDVAAGTLVVLNKPGPDPLAEEGEAGAAAPAGAKREAAEPAEVSK